LPKLDRQATIGLGERMEKASSRQAFRYVSERKVLAALADAKAHRIVDVGCGVGLTVRFLADKGFEVHGITINPQEVASRAHENVRLGDIQRDPATWNPDGQIFDAILCFDCLEHLESPLAALRNINRLLKPGGLFIAHLPSARWTECDYHVICYTPRQFRWLLNLAGFDLVRRTGRYYFKKHGPTYYATKVHEGRMVYPGALQ
jgi:2-polyprenyl-3-methyl-5-hydroxy-6-metoxy-1,4-benzoquinol methylase